MKTLLLLGLLAGGALTCMAADPVRPNEASASWVDPSDPAVKTIRQSGEQLINRIGHMLIFEVEHNIEDKGLAKTIELAHLKDLSLPNPQSGQPRVTAIKRTSLKVRNPANRPDPAEQTALDFIDAALRNGDDVPKVLIQRLDQPGAPVEWRVYRPIAAMPVCLNCHGPVEDLKPEVRSFLALHYPEDQAVGYTVYQWRGLIRVSFAAPEPAASKTK